MNRAARGFTLTELMVVVGVIGLIMAIMLPSFVTVTDLARETTCKNNLHLLSKSAAGYMIANNDVLPLNDHKAVTYDDVDANYVLPGRERPEVAMKWWCNKAYAYGVMKPDIYICPSDPGRANDVDPVQCGYGINVSLTDPINGDGVRTSFQIDDPERTAIIGHCSLYSNDPLIHEDMVLEKVWPIGHLKRYDPVAKEKEGRCSFIMASGAVLTWTFAQASEFKTNDEGKKVLILFRN